MNRIGTYPRTIHNGAGETLTFVRLVPTPRGGRLEGENRVSPGAGPPMHVHYLQDEGFTVVRGRLGVERPGRAPEFFDEGQSVVFKAGEPHRFWNAGEEELRCTGFIEPAGNAEFFLSALFASQKGNGGVRPSLLDAAFLTHRYRTEFAMLAIPPVARRTLIPVLAVVAGLTGRRRRFAGAPPPMASRGA